MPFGSSFDDSCLKSGDPPTALSPLCQETLPPFGFSSPPSPDGDATRTTGTAKMGAALPQWLTFYFCLVVPVWLLVQGEEIIPIPATKRRVYLEENIAAITFV
ncbi:hypothetical protein [Nostoc sp. PCC 7107]|uniref:hypothetical protein n=1 Tax=Nostoc sp. PCC 7107 TaxID=317936 RepID=UPI0012FAE5A9|nr:hypothetical protein [Nostoc sp. PCC 7107]